MEWVGKQRSQNIENKAFSVLLPPLLFLLVLHHFLTALITAPGPWNLPTIEVQTCAANQSCWLRIIMLIKLATHITQRNFEDARLTFRIFRETDT